MQNRQYRHGAYEPNLPHASRPLGAELLSVESTGTDRIMGTLTGRATVSALYGTAHTD